jgi:hypothetical protein
MVYFFLILEKKIFDVIISLTQPPRLSQVLVSKPLMKRNLGGFSLSPIWRYYA